MKMSVIFFFLQNKVRFKKFFTFVGNTVISLSVLGYLNTQK